jgi:hypothetical protein
MKYQKCFPQVLVSFFPPKSSFITVVAITAAVNEVLRADKYLKLTEAWTIALSHHKYVHITHVYLFHMSWVIPQERGF